MQSWSCMIMISSIKKTILFIIGFVFVSTLIAYFFRNHLLEDWCILRGGEPSRTYDYHDSQEVVSCSFKTNDGGKKCTDMSQCEAGCYLQYKRPISYKYSKVADLFPSWEIDNVIGECSSYTNNIDCNGYFVEKGKAFMVACVR